ncbi:MAG: xanthine dehydrogenase family protein molybdopterin-binding subunit [Rhodospirillaceae bacterium]|nr:xanthine dehydrogenase family protein molybdopterin-binding subunit [Rhodospirillaceae bacterium]
MSGDDQSTIEGTGVRKIGESVLRNEDLRYIQGQGQYSDDLNKTNQLYGFFVRSQIAHGIIKNINTTEADAAPGVIAVLTGKDFEADGYGPVIHRAIEASPEDFTKPAFDDTDPVAIQFPQWPMPFDKVRHVGEPIVFVVAETIAAAEEGAELVEVELDELPAIVDVHQAAADNAPEISEHAPGNIVIHHYGGAAEATDQALAESDVVVKGSFNVPRLISCQMEPRSGIAEYDLAEERYIVTAGNQGVHRYRDMIASALKAEPDQVQVICPDVGGGFGSRGHVGPEYVMLAWAAKRLGRPVKWTSSRIEAFISDWQGRDMLLNGELGLNQDGSINAYKLQVLINLGAFTICYAPPANASRLVTTTYDIPNASLDMQAYLTNTVPVLPFRAAGRPEIHFALERLIDMGASKIGMDRRELRLKNLIPQDAMPFTTVMGLTYDVGGFPEALNGVAKIMDWQGFASRREQSKANGKLRGISLVPFVETPVGAPFEMGRVEISAAGQATIFAGTQNHGQGHETTYPQVLSELLGIPYENISLAWGDSALLARGGGTHSDRSMRMMGTVLYEISKEIIEISKPVAAHLLQADETVIEFVEGKFRISATGQETDILAVAAAYAEFHSSSDPLMSEFLQEGRIKTYPYGASAAEIEIDPETGEMTICKYSIVDDCGQAVNPMIVHGQTHGGIVMGAGQAMGECAFFDLNSGQLITGSFMDYMMPRADQFPMFDIDTMEVPSDTNPLRIKAGGEAGTVPALAVIGNAVMDALSPYGIEHFDMPYTASRIWAEINQKIN